MGELRAALPPCRVSREGRGGSSAGRGLQETQSTRVPRCGGGGLVLGHHAAGGGWVGGFLHYPCCGHGEGSEGSAALREPGCRAAWLPGSRATEGLEDFSTIVIL